jgi:tRNA 2-thiouridine synthesizing protein D
MTDRKTITVAIMDAPYENARSTTALRLIDIAAKRGYNINVFAYEGAVLQPFQAQ